MSADNKATYANCHEKHNTGSNDDGTKDNHVDLNNDNAMWGMCTDGDGALCGTCQEESEPLTTQSKTEGQHQSKPDLASLWEQFKTEE